VDLTREDLAVPYRSFAESLSSPLAEGSIVASGRDESGGGSEFNAGKLTDEFFSIPKSEFPLKPVSTFMYDKTAGDTSDLPVATRPEAILSMPAIGLSQESIESMVPNLEGDMIVPASGDEDLNYRVVPSPSPQTSETSSQTPMRNEATLQYPSPPIPLTTKSIESESTTIENVIERIVESGGGPSGGDERDRSTGINAGPDPRFSPAPSSVESEPTIIDSSSSSVIEISRGDRTLPSATSPEPQVPTNSYQPPTRPSRSEETSSAVSPPSSSPTIQEAQRPPFVPREQIESESIPRTDVESDARSTGWKDVAGPTPIYSYSDTKESGRTPPPSSSGPAALEGEMSGGGISREIERIIREETTSKSSPVEPDETSSASSISVEPPPQKTSGGDVPAFGGIVTGVLSDEIGDVVPGISRGNAVNDSLKRAFSDMLDSRTEEIFGSIRDISEEVSKGNADKILDKFTEGL